MGCSPGLNLKPVSLLVGWLWQAGQTGIVRRVRLLRGHTRRPLHAIGTRTADLRLHFG